MTPKTTDELLLELQIGFDQSDAGLLVDWDPVAMKIEGRRRLHTSQAGQQIIRKLLGARPKQ